MLYRRHTKFYRSDDDTEVDLDTGETDTYTGEADPDVEVLVPPIQFRKRRQSPITLGEEI